MKIAVIGGNGFLGSHVYDQLLNIYKRNIYMIDINIDKYKGKNIIQGDISDFNFIKNKLKGIDVVYHFAGISSLDFAYNNPTQTVKSNILGTINILEACKINKVKKIVFASSMYVAGNHGSFYRCSKAACEDYIKEYHQRYKLKYSILRYGSLYGHRSNKENGLFRMVEKAIKDKELIYYGDINSRREYIHAEDAAKASLDCLKNFHNKTIKITGNQSLKVTDLLETVREILKIKKKIKVINKKQKGHYTLVPHNYDDKLVMKYSINPFVDLGEGIKSLIIYIKKKK